jgi:O-antigen ligase
MVGLIVSVAVGTAMAFDKTNAMQGLLAISIYFLMFLFFKNLSMDKRFLRKIILGISFSLLTVCSFALFHYYIYKENILIGSFRIERTNPSLSDHPLISILQHPALGANLIAVLLLFVLCYWFFYAGKIKIWEKCFYSFSLLASVFTIFASHNRGSILFLSAAFISIIIISRKWKALIIVGIVLGVFFCFPSEKVKATIMTPLKSPNIQGRLLQYQAGIEIFSKSNRAFGLGFLNFRIPFEENYKNNPSFEKVPYIHNTYLSILVETGIIGFLLFFPFIFILAFRSIKEYLLLNRFQYLLGFSAVFGFLANSLFDSTLYSIPIGIPLWIAFGLSQNKILRDSAEQ